MISLLTQKTQRLRRSGVWHLTWFLLSQLVVCTLVSSANVPTSHPAAVSFKPQDKPNELQKVQLDRVIDGTLAPPQSCVYAIDLVKGQHLQISLTSEQLLLGLGVAQADAKPVAGDSGVSAPSKRVISLIVPASGSYEIGISAHGKAPPGAYQLLVTTLPNPPPDFFVRARAQQLLTELNALYYQQRNKAAFLKMPEIGEEAARLFGQLGMLKMQTEALNLVAEAWRQLDEWNKALNAFERTMQISRAISYHYKQAEVLTFIGMCQYQVSDYRSAIEAYLKALPLWNLVVITEPVNMSGWTLTQLGYAYAALGESRLAVKAFEQAAQCYQRYNELGQGSENSTKEWHLGTAFCLRGLGRIHALAGEKQQAIDALTSALAHYQGAGDDYYTPLLLNDLGELYASLGEREQAFELYNQALKLVKRMGSRASEAQTLYLIGRWHEAAWHEVAGNQAALESLEQAKRHFRQALRLRREVGDRRGEAATLNGLGDIATVRRNHAHALELYTEALAIQRQIGDRYGEGFALNGGGVSYAALGDQPQASAWLQEALALRRAIGDREGEAQTLYQLARLTARLTNHSPGQPGKLHEARALIEAALQLTEFIRAGVLSQELRAYYLGTVGDYYEFYTELLMRLHEREPAAGYQALALRATELARARSLLELLAEAQVDLRADAPAELLARERELRQRLSAQAENQLRLQTGLLPAGPRTREQLALAAKSLKALNLEYQEVRARLRTASPRYAALMQPQPLAAAELQQLLDPDTLLLEYGLGKERSFLWAVTREQVTSYVLPPRAEINAAARQVYELLTARNSFDTRETAAQRRARIARADAELPAASRALSQLVLAPAAAQLGRKRLLIVAQEALLFVPFAVLPEGGTPPPEGEKPGTLHTGGKAGDPGFNYLLERHEIVHLPSASTLAWLRTPDRQRPRAPKTVALLADPVFSENDARVLAKRTLATPKLSATQNTTLMRTLRDLMDRDSKPELQVDRLPGTRWEAEQIAAMVPARERLEAVDFAANRALALSPELSQYRIVHLATHALINTVHPALSGIVLSLVDERGQPQNGFLSALEIYNLKLASELVVLSACQTGLGKEVRGEGLIGLTQSFLYAGTPRVVVSLWSMQDKATAVLMKRYYQQLLSPKPAGQPASPAALLRATQLEMKRSGRWPSPYFWAGFTLQGEWR